MPAPRVRLSARPTRAEETAIATQRKRTRATRGATPPARKPARARGKKAPAPPGARQKRAARPAAAVARGGYGFPKVPAPSKAGRGVARPGAMREIGWAAFGELAKSLAARISERYRPQAVVGIARGGVFVGAALSTALGAEFYPIRIERRRRDMGVLPHPIVELPDLAGKRVLVVDDLAGTGATLARARAVSKKAGAGEVRTAVLVARPGARPDFTVYETEELVLFAWDYQLDASGGAVDPGEVGV